LTDSAVGAFYPRHPNSVCGLNRRQKESPHKFLVLVLRPRLLAFDCENDDDEEENELVAAVPSA
jgi:hypothetical protein